MLSDRLKSELSTFKIRAQLNCVRIEPLLENVSSLLIVGSGSSATLESVKKASKDYKSIVTLNNALHLFPESNWHSFEFDFQNPKNLKTQLEWISKDNYRKFLIKPFSFLKLPKDLIRLVKEHDKNLAQLDRYEARIDWTPAKLIFPRRTRKLRFIDHQIFKFQHLTNPDYSCFLNRNRLPIQWRGSLSLWLDLVHLTRIRKVGLIGTDLTGQYSESCNPFGVTLDDVHGTNQQRSVNDPPALLEILEVLVKNRYLDQTSFEHFHTNDKLAKILSE